MSAPADTAGIVEELREEATRLSGRSIDRGCVDSGIAANLADRAADLIEAQAAELAEARAEAKDWQNAALLSACEAGSGLLEEATRARDEALAALGAAEERGRRLNAALEFIAKNKSRSLAFDGKTFCEDDNSDLWIVTEVQGGINDREWALLGSGATPAEALLDAVSGSGERPCHHRGCHSKRDGEDGAGR